MLPDDVRGNWIWTQAEPTAIEHYCLFRREFMLSETPASAELWITAGTFFHLYLNGRHLGFGPCPTPPDMASVINLDASYFLQTGKNVLAVLAHNTRVARSHCPRHPSGFWCQLNIDDRPTLWTDASWRTRSAGFFRPGRPRRSAATAFTEKVDLRDYPADWKDEDAETKDWFPPQKIIPVANVPTRFIQSRLPEFSSTHRPFDRIHSAGSSEISKTVAYVSFDELLAKRGPGVYMAETYVHSDSDCRHRLLLGNDNPYRLFVNQKLVKAQGSASLSPGADLLRSAPPCFAESDQEDPLGEIALQEGWNHILIYQQAEPGCAGATLALPELPAAPLRFRRSPEEYGVPGWSLLGPLHTPLAHTTGAPLSQEFSRVAYNPERCQPDDEGSLTAAYDFQPKATSNNTPANFKLREGDYIILELEATTYACPAFKIAGNSGDVVHIVCGEKIVDNRVVPTGNPLHNVDTVICGDAECQWLSCHPRGIRYMMIQASRACSTVAFSETGIRVREFNFNRIGDFQCDAPILNQIWETGRRTLAATIQGVFLDAPSGDSAQYIADAMIQSWSACHVFGAYELTARSLEDFANAQFETGEMRAVAPSDLYSHIPDFSLLWPIWLQRHYLYTGDRHLMARLLPAMVRLFDFFAAVAEPQTGLLTDLENQWTATCFLDHGSIDRAGIVTGLNAIYCRSLFSGARLLEDLGDHDQAQALRDRATQLAQRLRQLTWNPVTERFADGWHHGAPSPQSSWQTNVLAIYGGIADPEKSEQLFEKLFRQEPPYEPLDGTGPDSNAYFRYFIIESALALDKRTWALDMIRNYWGGMLDRNATTWWEFFDPDSDSQTPAEGSLCNGAATAPSAYLCTELAGIRPAKPGFSTVVFNPALGIANWVKAQIPTVYGHIMIEWSFSKDNQLEAVIDANFPLEVIPVFPATIADNATFHVSDDVTILASPA